MGIIQRQATRVSIVSYLGVLLGYVNLVLLFPKILEPEQLGLTRLLLSACTIFSQFALLGVPHITYKFFPFFRDKAQQHRGYLSFALVLPAIGFIIFVAIFFLVKRWLLGIYENKSPMFVDYYFYIFPMTLFIVYFEVLFAYSCSLLKTVVPSFVKEILIRAYQFIIILLYQFDLFQFEVFLFLFVMGYVLPIMAMIVYLGYLKQLFLKPDFSFFTGKLRNEIKEYGSYIFLAGVASLLVGNLDVLMLGFIAGLSDTAVYSVAFYVGLLIIIPAKSIFLSAFPIISQAWKNEDTKTIASIYKKTALNQFIIGSLLMILVWVNADNIIRILPEKYAGGKYVMLFVGLGKLFDMATGIVGGIINTSKHYRFILFSNLFLILVTVILNYFFINQYGIIGAALSTMISVMIYNSINVAFVFSKFKMQPFTGRTLKVLFISAVIILLSYYLPTIHNVWLDILTKSVLLIIAFITPILLLKVSEDVNHAFHVIKGKLLNPK